MNSRKSILCIITLTFLPLIVCADIVSERKFEFIIENNSGSRETAILRYQAHVTSYCNGSGSISTWDHPIDTRRVEWGVDSWIQRDICSASILGEQCEGKWTKLFKDTRSEQSARPDILRLNLRHTTCGNVARNISNARSQAERNTIDALNGIMNKDIDEIFSLLSKGGVRRVIHGAPCLNDVSTFADKICGQIQTSGTSRITEASGELKANVSGIVRKVLGDVGANIDGRKIIEAYENVLRKDLSNELFNIRACRIKMVDIGQAELCKRDTPDTK